MTKRQKTNATTNKNAIKHKSGKELADFSSFTPPSVVDLGDELAFVTVVIGLRPAEVEVGMLINLRLLLIMHIWKIYD